MIFVIEYYKQINIQYNTCQTIFFGGKPSLTYKNVVHVTECLICSYP